MKKLFLSVFIAIVSFFSWPPMALADGLHNADYQITQIPMYENIISEVSLDTDRPDSQSACGNCHTESGITDKMSKVDYDRSLYTVYAMFHTSGFERKHRSI